MEQNAKKVYEKFLEGRTKSFAVFNDWKDSPLRFFSQTTEKARTEEQGQSRDERSLTKNTVYRQPALLLN